MNIIRKAKTLLVSDAAETVIRLLVVLSIMFTLGASYQVMALYKCQARYAEASADALRARDTARQADQTATDKMVISVSTATSGTQVAAALHEYVETRAKSDQERAQKPLPVPENFC
jgi:hypothetical protein